MAAWGYFEELNPRSLGVILKRAPVAYIPIGAYEWHGGALPFGTDTYRVRHVAAAVARKLGGVVLPSAWGTDIVRESQGRTWWGMETFVETPLPGNACMLSAATFRRVLDDMIQSCIHLGFHRVLLLTGHGAKNQIALMRQAAKRANRRGEIQAHYVDFWKIYHAGPDTEQHGGAAEIAEMLVLQPHLVDVRRFAATAVEQATGLDKRQLRLADPAFGRQLLSGQARDIIAEMKAVWGG